MLTATLTYTHDGVTHSCTVLANRWHRPGKFRSAQGATEAGKKFGGQAIRLDGDTFYYVRMP